MKKRLIFSVIALITVLLLLSACGADEIAAPRNTTPADTAPVETTPADTTTVVASVCPPIYSIDSFRSMNAVIVKWGAQNETRWEDPTTHTVYVDVDAEFVKVFDQTMQKSNYTQFYGNISKTDFLMIPEQYLGHTTEGRMSLVFLDLIYSRTAVIDINRLGVWLGDAIGEGEYAYPPIFQIEEDKILVPDKAYLQKSDSSDYFTNKMTALQSANEYVKVILGKSLRFENGISTAALDEYFTLICK